MDSVAPFNRRPRSGIDRTLADALKSLDDTARFASGELMARDALNGYTRSLTDRGGLLVRYRDQLSNSLVDIVRASLWTVATGYSGWLLLFRSPLSFPWCLAALVGLGLVLRLIIYWRIERWHSIEIHPDGMEVDGRFFSADLIGANWPQLQMKNDAPNRLMLCGVYGTRFVEYATANRLGGNSNDRTPEILAQDLELAMEQLWGRRDAMFASPD